MRVFATSIPKAGTHLLKKCLRLMPTLIETSIHFEGNMDPQEMEGLLASVPDRGWVTAHLPPSESLCALLRKYGYRSILIIRDPRDVVVSYTHYVCGKSDHFLHGYYRELPSHDERLMATIEGVVGDGTRRLLSIEEVYRSFLCWGNYDFNLAVSYEALVGPKGGGREDIQLAEIERVSRHLGIHLDARAIASIGHGLFDVKSPTFRKGVIGSWREEFKPGHSSAIERIAGPIMKELGYLDAKATEALLAAATHAHDDSWKERIRPLTSDLILRGVGEADGEYPSILPVTLWRAWEQEALKKVALRGKVLDVGAALGQRALELWPRVQRLTGIALREETLGEATDTHAYDRVLVGVSGMQAVKAGSMDGVVLYRVLEMSEDSQAILREASRCLRHRGDLVIVMLTDRILEWSPIVSFLSAISLGETAQDLTDRYLKLHGYRNLIGLDQLFREPALEAFRVETIVPLVPRLAASAFILADQLWHIPDGGADLGRRLLKEVRGWKNYTEGLGAIVAGLQLLEPLPREGLGAMVHMTKARA